jgi:hypothetical protein
MLTPSTPRYHSAPMERTQTARSTSWNPSFPSARPTSGTKRAHAQSASSSSTAATPTATCRTSGSSRLLARRAAPATSTTRSGSPTSSESTCAPTQPSSVGTWARKPIATSPASSSVVVTTT